MEGAGTAQQTVDAASGQYAAHAGVVEVRGLSKRFKKGDRDLVALSDVNLTIRDGEFISLVGPSGCGKSTLLRIIGGLTPATSGEVRVEGKVVDQTHPDVSLMFQAPTLFPWRTVLSNVLLPVEIQNKPNETEINRAKELIDLVGLKEFIDHHPRELSGGMQQRVALSRVLITDPRIMLLDEPFGALDEFTRENLNVELGSIVARSKRSVVLVTHSISEAVFLADRVVAMGTNPGRILGEVPIPFEQPRRPSLVRTTEFQELAFRVRRILGLE